MQDDVGPKLALIERQANRSWQRISGSFVRGVTISGRQLEMLSRQHLQLATRAVRQFAETIPSQLAGVETSSIQALSKMRSAQLQLSGPMETMLGVARALSGIRGGAELFRQQTQQIVAAAGGLRIFRMRLSETAEEAPEQFAKGFVALRTLMGQLPPDLGKAFASAARAGGVEATRALAEAAGRPDILAALDTQLSQVPDKFQSAILEGIQKSLLAGPVSLSGPITRAVQRWIQPIETGALAAFREGHGVLGKTGGMLRGWSTSFAETMPRVSRVMEDVGGALDVLGKESQAAGGGLTGLGAVIGSLIAPGIGTAIGTAIGALAGMIVGPLLPLLAAFAPMRLLAEALAPIIKLMKNTLMPLLAPLQELLIHVVAALRPIIYALLPIFHAAAEEMIRTLVPLIRTLSEEIARLATEVTPELIAGIRIATRLAIFIPRTLEGILKSIPGTRLVSFLLLTVDAFKALEETLERMTGIPLIRFLLRQMGIRFGGEVGPAAPPSAIPPSPGTPWAPVMARVPALPQVSPAQIPIPAPSMPVAAHVMPTTPPGTFRGLVPGQVVPAAAPLPMAAAVAVAPPVGPRAAPYRAVSAEEPGGVLSTLFSPFGPFKLAVQYLLRPMLKEIVAPMGGPLLDIVTGVGDVETAVRAGQPAAREVDPEFDQGVLYAAGLQEVWV